MFGAKLSWCQIVRCQIVHFYYVGAKLSWCQIVVCQIVLVPNCPTTQIWADSCWCSCPCWIKMGNSAQYKTVDRRWLEWGKKFFRRAWLKFNSYYSLVCLFLPLIMFCVDNIKNRFKLFLCFRKGLSLPFDFAVGVHFDRLSRCNGRATFDIIAR